MIAPQPVGQLGREWVSSKITTASIAAMVVTCMTTASGAIADTLITNARIIDGTGSPVMMGSVRLSGDRITALGDLAAGDADQIIDANGLVLAPGFIDTHSHSDRLILAERAALAKITQGITTAVVGQDGDSPYPLANFYAALEAAPAKINVAAYAGHNTLREKVMGADFKRPASNEEMKAMSALLARARGRRGGAFHRIGI